MHHEKEGNATMAKQGLIRLEMLNAQVGTHIMVRLISPNGDIVFDVSEYDKGFKSGTADIFAEINDYFTTLTPEAQVKIANCYSEIYQTFLSVPDTSRVKEEIQKTLKEMYSVLDYETILQWVKFQRRPRIPPTMRDDYLVTDPPDRRRTYIYKDYVELVALAVMLRPMVPIWGEYILRNKKIAGTDYKELQAIKLLYHTGVTELRPAKRLLDYIHATTSYEDPVFASVVQGLGTEERPEWLLALNLIRRVATGEIDSTDPNSNIVTNAYNYTRTKLEQLAKKNNIKAKDKPQRGPEDDNVSYLEMYKVKEKVPRGRIAPIEVYTENPLSVAARIDESVPEALVRECLEAVKAIESQPTYQHQIVLTQWTLAKAISPKGIETLNRISILRCIGVTQALLWHWGYFDLAALVTACPYPIEEDQILANLEGRAKIPANLAEELGVIYKHYVVSGTKADRAKVAAGKIPNMAIDAIENYVKLIKQHDWELYAPQALQDKTSKILHTRRLIVPADIRAQLADMVLRLNR
jgi:hypothetical protein